MLEKIEDIRKRHVFNPKQPAVCKPVEKESYLHGYNDGWNAAVAYYKEVGKI